jgi:hypothetical protein
MIRWFVKRFHENGDERVAFLKGYSCYNYLAADAVLPAALSFPAAAVAG